MDKIPVQLKKSLTVAFLFVIWAILLPSGVQAQRGIGVRFGSDFNYLFRAKELPVREGFFSNGVLGAFYQAYFKHGGFRIGVNGIWKPPGNGMPVIQQDFNKNNNIGFGGVEVDLKVGPRFWFINPQIGYIMGWRFAQSGFLDDGKTGKNTNFYLHLPFGVTAEWPTGYGSVGFGVFYEVGLTNVLKDPVPKDKQPYDGSKFRSINFEITTVFAAGKQQRKLKPPKPGEE